MRGAPRDLPALLRVLIGVHAGEAPSQIAPGARFALPLALARGRHVASVIPRLALAGLVEFRDVSELGADQERCDLAPLDTLLTEVAGHAEDAIHALDDLETAWSAWRKAVAGARADVNLIAIVDLMAALPALTAPMLARMQSLNPKTAQRRIAALKDLGVLREGSGRARNRVFVAGDLGRLSPAARAGRALWAANAPSESSVEPGLTPALPAEPMDVDARMAEIHALADEIGAKADAAVRKHREWAETRNQT